MNLLGIKHNTNNLFRRMSMTFYIKVRLTYCTFTYNTLISAKIEQISFYIQPIAIAMCNRKLSTDDFFRFLQLKIYFRPKLYFRIIAFC